MTAWVQVLVAMADGPNAPVQGVIRKTPEDRPERVNFATVGDRMPMLVGVGGGDVRIWRDQAKVRVETLDGQPLFISDGANAWQFEQPGEPPRHGGAGRVRYIGTGRDLLFNRPAHDWLGNDYTRPTGSVCDAEFLDRPCWTVELAPPRHKDGALQLVVDAETGAVLAQRNDTAGIAVSFIEITVGEPIDPALFVWTGTVHSDVDRQHEHAAQREADRATQLEWFRQHVTERPLTVPVVLDLSVDHVRITDEETGAFEASLGGGLISGMLARRPHSDQPWELRWHGTVRHWRTGDFDWAAVLHQGDLDPTALTALQTALHPDQTVVTDQEFRPHPNRGGTPAS